MTLPICFSWEGKDGNPVTQTLFKRGTQQSLTAGQVQQGCTGRDPASGSYWTMGMRRPCLSG